MAVLYYSAFYKQPDRTYDALLNIHTTLADIYLLF